MIKEERKNIGNLFCFLFFFSRSFLGGYLLPELGEGFPGASQIELSEFLRHLQWFLHDTLKFVVVSKLIVSSEREVFPEWMPGETIVSKKSSQIGVASEEDAIHVVNLSFIPVGAGVDVRERVDSCQFIGVGFHPDTLVVPDRQQVVDNLESAWPPWHIDASQIRQIVELAQAVIT